MPHPADVVPPKNDEDYFGRMHKSIFSAGLNWSVVEKKWPSFQKPFAGFSPDKVARFTESDVKKLMGDEGLIRNEKKIRATIHNAKEYVKLRDEFGSFEKYMRTFGKDEAKLLADLQIRFHHLGPSSARTFLWSIGYPLKPTPEERKWMAGRGEQGKGVAFGATTLAPVRS
jgi:3-methyladenine DNA glycosylase Tag